MTENGDNSFLGSSLGRAILTIIAVLLVFAGPTYVVYGIAVGLNMGIIAAAAVGIVLFIVGIFMMRYLMQKGIIS
ncbi:MAG: hypothetical protein NWF04_09260 [Candidatus Bathyarchaeota archaeon]|nr:hypothetical protein [Candidatus Bathyarchaeota archaeon]